MEKDFAALEADVVLLKAKLDMVVKSYWNSKTEPSTTVLDEVSTLNSHSPTAVRTIIDTK
jgi:hypothetical protein